MKIKMFLLAVSATAAMFLSACSPSPSSTVNKWQQAILSGSVDDANKYSTEQTQMLNSFFVKAVKDDQNNDAAKNLRNMKITREEINGDTAIVYTNEGDGEEGKIQLKKVDGEWKVDFRKN